MRVNAEFDRKVRVRFAESDWVASPAPGVERRFLDRIGDEVARATTIVRFAPGAEFHAHTHDGGEEYLVLEGMFQDADGDFPAGSYVRNPPTTSHHPRAEDGTVILVKLHQVDPSDRTEVHARMSPEATEQDPDRPGVRVQLLHADARETVRFEVWEPGAQVRLDLPGGGEIFVLAGGFAEGGVDMARWDWLRLPAGAALRAEAGPEGAQVWVKTGHLAAPIGLEMPA